MNIDLDLQIASHTEEEVPDYDNFYKWVASVLEKYHKLDTELTIRVVNEIEMARLNEDYRDKPGTTNVLTFPFEPPPNLLLPILGDIVICAPVITREAKEQHKTLVSHWAHITIHGCLHLLGFDHIEPDEAEEMESIEVALMQELGFSNPYGEHVNNER
jgi:probable rRNA maturation factor